MREHKTLTCGQPYVHNARVNSHLTEPCFDAKTVELFSIGYPDSGSGKGSCRLSADMLSERIDYSTVIWTHDSPDAEQHAATRNEYSPHFAERSRSVRKELKTLLTHDDIKRGAREVHGHGAAFHLQTPDRKPSGQRALEAEAHQTRICAYLSAILLIGLGLNAWLGWWWADPFAGLLMVPLIGWEGWEAVRGHTCCD